MCDFSIKAAKSRDAKVGDKLVTKRFPGGTIGFCAAEDNNVAVCLRPGTEIAFDGGQPFSYNSKMASAVAIFRQQNLEIERIHHDALEFSDGSTATLAGINEGQAATVLQLPVDPEAKRAFTTMAGTDVRETV